MFFFFFSSYPGTSIIECWSFDLFTFEVIIDMYVSIAIFSIGEVSQTILSSFHSLYFILLFRGYFYHFNFQLTDLFCFRYSEYSDILIPSRIFLMSVVVLFVSVCLFFNYSRSLLTDSCIFSILFSRFLIIFTIFILNSLPASILFPIHLFGLLCFPLFLHLFGISLSSLFIYLF